jgi:hypothetical protein
LKRHRPVEPQDANAGTVLATDTLMKSTRESRCRELEAEVKRLIVKVDIETSAKDFIQREFDKLNDK